MSYDYKRPIALFDPATFGAKPYWAVYQYAGNSIAVCPVTRRISVITENPFDSSSHYVAESLDAGNTWVQFHNAIAYMGGDFGLPYAVHIMYDHEGTLHVVTTKTVPGGSRTEYTRRKEPPYFPYLFKYQGYDNRPIHDPDVLLIEGNNFLSGAAMNDNGDIVAAYHKQMESGGRYQNEIFISLFDHAADTWGNATQLSNFLTEFPSGNTIKNSRVPVAVSLDNNRNVHVASYTYQSYPTYFRRDYWAKWNAGGWFDVQAHEDMFPSEPNDVYGSSIDLLLTSTGTLYAAMAGRHILTSGDTSLWVWEWNPATETWNPRVDVRTNGFEAPLDCFLQEKADGTLRLVATGLGLRGGDGTVNTNYYLDRSAAGVWDTDITYALYPGDWATAPPPDYETPTGARSPGRNIPIVRDAGLFTTMGYRYGDPFPAWAKMFFYRNDDALCINIEQAFEYQLETLVPYKLYEDGEQLNAVRALKLLDNIPGTATIAYKQLIVENATAQDIASWGLRVVDPGDIGSVSLATGNVGDSVADAVQYEYNESAFILELQGSGGQGCIWVKWTRPTTESSGTNEVDFLIKVT